jgi:hypothetical protein
MASGPGPGDTYRELHAVYPASKSGGPGVISIKAPGAAVPAHYEVYVLLDDVPLPSSKIDGMSLLVDDDPCIDK